MSEVVMRHLYSTIDLDRNEHIESWSCVCKPARLKATQGKGIVALHRNLHKQRVFSDLETILK